MANSKVLRQINSPVWLIDSIVCYDYKNYFIINALSDIAACGTEGAVLL